MKTLVRSFALLFPAMIAGAAGAEQPPAGGSDPLMAMLERSMAEKKGVTLYSNGNQIGGAVTAIDKNFVTLRSQANPYIVVRIDRIDGVAGY